MKKMHLRLTVPHSDYFDHVLACGRKMTNDHTADESKVTCQDCLSGRRFASNITIAPRRDEKFTIDTVLGFSADEYGGGIRITQDDEAMGQTNVVAVDFTQLDSFIDYLRGIQERDR